VIPGKHPQFDHIGVDTHRHCLDCGHHHCRVCGKCHRCGCEVYRRQKRKKKKKGG